jgi:hypothetical protein
MAVNTVIQEVAAQSADRLLVLSMMATTLLMHLLSQAMAPGIEVPVVPELVVPVVHKVSVQPGREMVAMLVVRYIAVNTVDQEMTAEVISLHRKVLKAAIIDLLHRLYQVIVPKLVVIVVYEVSAPVGPRLPAGMLGQ